MRRILIVAKKEVQDAIRSKQALALIAFLSLSILLSVWVASAAFSVKMDEYSLYLAALTPGMQAQELARPQLFPLTLIRSGIEYIEILGALFAFILGFTSVSRERSRGTSLLLLSRPIKKSEILLAKVLGLFVIWTVVLGSIYLTSVAAIIGIGHGRLLGIDYLRLAIVFLVADVYLLFWSFFSVAITARLKQYSSAILVGITSWLIVVLVVPQIGDTMDVDNQIPGGLFGSLGIVKSTETSILAQFHTFDVIRNGLEVSSITKLFERVAFAFLGIKDKYNQLPISQVAKALESSLIALFISTAVIGIITVMISRSEKTLRRRNS